MIPIRAWIVIFWNIDRIMLCLARLNIQKYIIRCISGRHMKSMEMEVGRLIEIVYQINLHSVSRIDMESGPHERTIVYHSSDCLVVHITYLVISNECSLQNSIFAVYIYRL